MKTPPPAIRLERDVEMRTRDGVVLRADVMRPEAEARVPALLCRTPYDKRLRLSAYAHLRAIDAAAAGFAVAFQDVRGRFASDGEWAVMDWGGIERRDGHDAVEWLAAEPWCDGNVGLFGGSYEGLNAIAAAAARPPSLRAIAPALLGSADSRKTTMMLEGIVLSWSALVAVDVVAKRRARGEGDPTELARVMAALVDPATAARTLPLDALPPLTIPGMPSYEELTARLLASNESITAAVESIEVPSLWTTGWWDQAGGSDLFRRVRKGRAAAEAKLLVGPWSHTEHDSHLGELGFGQLASLLGAGVGAAHLSFFSRHLRDCGVPALPTVRYFATGVNEWRSAAEWPPPETVERRFFLRAERSAASARGDGALAEEAPSTGQLPDRYLHDPADPVPSVGWRALNLGGSTVPGPFDQHRVEARNDVLVYSTPPLDECMAAAGDARVVLHVATTAPDTDFMAKLCDVDREGVSRNVADGALRLRWRDGGEMPRFVVPGEVVEITIELGMVGHVFGVGHRVRLQVASSAFPHFDRNMNTGARIGSEVCGIVAEQTVFHDAARPSHLVLGSCPPMCNTTT